MSFIFLSYYVRVVFFIVFCYNCLILFNYLVVFLSFRICALMSFFSTVVRLLLLFSCSFDIDVMLN